MRKCAPSVSLLCLFLASAAAAGEDIVIKEGLHLRLPRRLQWSALAVDPVEMAIAAGTWRAPKEGESVTFSASESEKWRRVAADADGWFAVPGDGYLYSAVNSDRDPIMILNGLGDAYVYVNGELRMGGKYATKETYESWEPRFDYGQVPVFLKKGENRLIFRCARGRLKASLSPPASPCFLNERDLTVPDVLIGESFEAWGAIVVVNATIRIRRDLVLAVSGDGLESTAIKVGTLQPLSVRKAAFLLKGPAPRDPAKISVRLSLREGDAAGSGPLHEVSFPVEAKSPFQNHKRTFRSEIDGSVQYYAVNPAQNRDPDFKPALVLSVHGAGVEAVNQAGSYEPKTWTHVVAPTNRRPYGFDWEDWGRIDAIEAMSDFARRYPADLGRVYLTGHSMGGHGAWILGAQFPDLFAAVGPSAGWISFRTYASRQKDEGSAEIEKLVARPLLQGDTLAVVRNLLPRGVYILHGEKDESVAVRQAREMAGTLAEFHKDFVYHEEKGASHWWDKSDEPGTDCVDWAPMFDFFARHRLPGVEEVREVRFVTANPGLSSRCHWARIEAQVEPLQSSSIDLRLDPGTRRFAGTTENVARLALEIPAPAAAGEVTIQLDGQTLKANPREGILWLHREDSAWKIGERPSPALKGPHRNGPFKDAFRNRMMFVFGTAGNKDENAWAFAKARFDAECFQYQGNGAIELAADTDFDPAADPNRNVILYGNAATNKAWKALLGESDVQVGRGYIDAGGRRFEGKDLACLFLKPRPKSDSACVGVVSGTGILGMRLTNTRPYLYAGYALPDFVVFGPGTAAGGGIKMAGFFGPDWTAASGDFLSETR
jgi:dienelactone hydrolase